VHLHIDRLEGKWKMSQNRVNADTAGVIDGLNASDSARDREVARIVSERRPRVNTE
jgi:transcriptional regulator